eukprot:TRINITY_DN2236_c2_g1_i1.p1 TRINITY_DN2236_c2_g1~~TRINITY_DN2236_c2_g1_i1.p1  ORF type:complete len:599 (+),score=96.10 TRINITY_DN2236_c2_g1_i1:56-1852(+)
MPAYNAQGCLSQDVVHLVKAQRRVRGTVADVTPGACKIESAYGVFSFDPRSVKANKNHPDRKPEVGDPCEFRLSHHVPPAAVSIRVAVPKVRRPAVVADTHDLSTCSKLLEEHCEHIAPLISKLDEGLRMPITVLYLVVEQLDRIETTNVLSAPVRQLILRAYPSYFESPENLPSELKSDPLFQKFSAVAAVVMSLPAGQRQGIRQTAVKRGELLASFQGREVMSLQDNTDYLTAVGGVVMNGVSSVVENHTGRVIDKKLATATGLLIEKTRAVRSFLEHSDTGRSSRWPKEVWGHHFDCFGQLAAPRSRKDAVTSLNIMVKDALQHVADTVDYLRSLVELPSIFTFVAIPCVLSLNHILLLWNNQSVFQGPLSLSPNTVVEVLQMEEPREAVWWLLKFVSEFQQKLAVSDQNQVLYEALVQMDGIRSAIRRIETDVGRSSNTNKSLTRALVSEQGAAIGGRLLYSMIDSLNTVFQPSGQHNPYSFTHCDLSPSGSGPGSIADGSVSEEGDTLKSGAISFFSRITRGWFGMKDAEDVNEASKHENFASFYEGGCDLDETSSEEGSQNVGRSRSQSLSSTTPPVSVASRRTSAARSFTS